MRSEGGMPVNGNLFCRSEKVNMLIIRIAVRRKHESGSRIIEFAHNLLYTPIRQAIGIRYHPSRISRL